MTNLWYAIVSAKNGDFLYNIGGGGIRTYRYSIQAREDRAEFVRVHKEYFKKSDLKIVKIRENIEVLKELKY